MTRNVARDCHERQDACGFVSRCPPHLEADGPLYIGVAVGSERSHGIEVSVGAVARVPDGQR